MSVFFDGKLLNTPTTASAVNDDAMLNQNLSVGNVVAYIGESTGGESMKVLSFSNPNAARQALVSGELCDAVVAAFAPSTQTGAPQTVKAIRVNKAFQAQLALPVAPGATSASGAFGTVGGKTFSQTDMAIKVKIEQGSTAKLFTVTVAGGKDASAWSFTGDDINAPRVHLAIAAADCHMLIGGPTDDLIEFVVDEKADPASGEYQKHTLPLSQYPTVGDIVDYAQTLTNAAGVKPFVFTFDDAADRLLSSAIFDQGAYATTTATPTLTADLSWNGYSIKNWFDTTVSNFVTFELNEANAIAWAHGLIPADYKYLAAAPVQNPTNQDWADAFDLLAKDRNVQWVNALSGSESIHALALHHVTTASNKYKERRAICGTGLNVSDTEAVQRAKNINSPRVSLVHIGHYAYNASGKLDLRPAYMTAALVAACFAGVNPGTPLTNKSLAVQGLERDLDNPTDTDILLSGGVMPVENTEDGYKVTQSISTWLGDTKYNLREQSCGVAVDFTQRNVRQALNQLRGSKQSPILLGRALSVVKGQLTELARPEPMGPAVLVGDDTNPPFRNITGTVEGDVLRIQYEASPVIPNNYILVTMYANPYSGTATA